MASKTFPLALRRCLNHGTLETTKSYSTTYTSTTSARTPLKKPPITVPYRPQRHHISTYGYTQAKCLVYSSYGEPADVLQLHGHSISPPTGTAVTLRNLAAPLNPADINQIQGVYPSKPGMNTLLGTSAPSAVAGNECCAEVIATGSGVRSVGKGDWVVMRKTGMGTWRTHMQLDESELLKIDDRSGLSPIQAGTVSVNPCTAYRMLKDFVDWDWGRSGSGGGEWFIQNGANSGVGRAAIQLGREWGLKSINVIRERPGWEELRRELLDLGATVVVTEDDLLGAKKGFGDRVKEEWTNGGREPIRLALNCVGGKSATAIAKLLSPRAHMVSYGAMSKQPVMLPTGLLIFKEIVFDGFWVSQWSDRNPAEKKATVDDILRMTRQVRFRDIPVDEVPWNWDTTIDSLREAAQGTLDGHRKGKGVFVFGDM